MKTRTIIAILAVTAVLGASLGFSEEPKQTKDAAKGSEVKAQTTCPVMDAKVNKKLFVDTKGYRIYVCCRGCIAKVKADPDKYIEKITAKGETLEKTPEAVKDKNKEGKG